jgi:translation initiation factor IF-2
VLVAKKPEAAKTAVSRKPSKALCTSLPGSGAPAKRAAGGAARLPAGNKEVKSAKLSSSWADDASQEESKSKPVATPVVASGATTGAEAPEVAVSSERDREEPPVQCRTR